MQMYVNNYQRELTAPDENPPIGIVLCTDKSEAVVRYACRPWEEPTGSGDDGEVLGNHRETGEVREEATPPIRASDLGRVRVQ